jgi:DNA-binding NarL/FixJ family response regulator
VDSTRTGASRKTLPYSDLATSSIEFAIGRIHACSDLNIRRVRWGGKILRTTCTSHEPGEQYMEPLRLLVADDHEIVRKGLRSLLEAQPGWQVAGEASDGREAVEKAKELRPDVTVLDIGMPSLNGLEATRQMLKNDARAKILILTMHESDPLIRDVLDAGARGYVLKTDASRDLVTAVNAVRSNKTFFTAKVAQMVLDGYLDQAPKKEKPQPESPKTRLTPRQREIVQLLAEGKSSKEVAVKLGLSVKTAETHRANIMRRLDCHSVSELVRYAVRNNIIEA